jgi:pantoate--beta-alanine ligase
MNINIGYFRNSFSIEMKLFKTVEDTRNHVRSLSNQQLTVGFVATMGALHDGHLALVQRAVRENDRVAVSIFVNPIQFNNPADLEKYPRNLEADLEKLSPLLSGEDFIFAPTEAEMYPVPETRVYDFGSLAGVMEGRFRPGHFNGVGVVVNKLFRIISPGKAYFGEKDFQQLAIIRRLTAIENLPVKVIPCAIVRESDGLAMSSRNIRLSPEHREAAPLIYSTIREASERLSACGPGELRQFITSALNATRLLRVEYVEFADEETLAPVTSWSDSDAIRCFIAVQAGEVRLIDNIHCPK